MKIAQKYIFFTLTALFALALVLVFYPTSASAAVGNWYKDPFGIATFVNSKGYNVEALRYDSATATKVCQLAGYTDVQSYDCVSTYDWGRCGWFSCWDNTLSYWNGSTFVSMNACTAGNTWISSLVCKSTPISLSVSVSPNPATTGQTVTFTPSVSGGTGSYTYSWTGNCTGTSASCSKSFSTAGTYTATLTVTSGNQTKSASATVTVNQACTPHASKQCSGNAVYWYDSCGNKEELYKTCSSSQTCQNGQCVNISCSSSSDCGTSGYIDSPYCQGNNVYQNYKTYTCNNPGTANSSCSSSVEAKLKKTCSSGQTCQNGACISANITCTSNSDCGANGYIDSPYCQGNNVYQNYKTYTCNNPGTASSSCSSSVEAKLKQNCASNQTCQNGACVTSQTDLMVSCYATPNPASQNQQVTFISSASGGTGAYNYSWSGACTGNSQTCYNTFYQTGVRTATVSVTSGSRSNSATCSVNVNPEYGNITVQTNPATNISSNQVTLNGHLYNNVTSCNVYVWFEYGPTTSYGYQTTRQLRNYTGSFSQLINLYGNYTNYHFRAAAQDCQGNIIYGQGATFSTGAGGGNLTINKTARNLTTGSGFSNSVSAGPSDMLMFMITLQAQGNQSTSNIYVRDAFPNNLIYKNQLVVSGASYTGDINSGITINTISGGQTVTITYQAQVASADNFSYGTTTLNNSVSATSSGSGYNPTGSASIIVTRSAVYAASSVSTGLTNNFWVDSFFLPLLITLIVIWMWRSGMFFSIERWLANKKKISRAYKSEKELGSRIAIIQKTEKI